MNYNEERANRTFSIFLIGVGVAMATGFLMGCLASFLFFSK
jgi:hypothetical protein